jgi:hypothetical protein
MIDTVRLVLSKILLPHELDDEKWRPTRLYDLFRLDCKKFDPSLDHVYATYNEKKAELVLEASLPRVIQGHNSVLLNLPNIHRAIERLQGLVDWSLTDYWNQSLFPPNTIPPLSAWAVRRIDVAFDFAPRRVPFAAAIEGLLNLRPPARYTECRYPGETLYFENSGQRRTFQFCIYDKAVEAKKKTPVTAHLAQGKIRLEARFFGIAMVRRAFGLSGVPTLGAFLDARLLHKVFRQRLGLFDVRPGLESVLTGFDVLKDRVVAKAARRLWSYAEARGKSSRKEIVKRWGISEETARRYERELRGVGLFPATVHVAGILEELLRQVDDAFALSAVTDGDNGAGYLPSQEGGADSVDETLVVAGQVAAGGEG